MQRVVRVAGRSRGDEPSLRLKNGFLARTMKEEIGASPDSRLYVTTAIEDVTKQILAAFPKNSGDAARARLITRRRREMIDACEKAGGVRCVVASFFEGAQYLKITQLEVRDIRLVYAPPLGIGNFGDEPDNWMWPRHTGDFSFYRAYVGRDGKAADPSPDNVPYRPKHWLKSSTRDLDEGDLMLLAGYPGTTSRHKTATEVGMSAQSGLPAGLRYRTMLVNTLRERGKNDRAIALKNASRIAGLVNYQKKYTGELEAFKRAGIVEAKRKKRRRSAARSIRSSRPRTMPRSRNCSRSSPKIAGRRSATPCSRGSTPPRRCSRRPGSCTS